MADVMTLHTQLRTEIKELEFKQYDRLDAIKRKSDMIIRNIFGQDSKYLRDLENIHFSPIVWSTAMTDEDERPSWNSGQSELLNLVDTMLEELNLFGSLTIQKTKDADEKRIERGLSDAVFIVHGHDEEMKQAVARTLGMLDLKPIILHEQANRGQTIIEKFMEHSEQTSFAIVLLSPDDLAFQKNEEPSVARFRARQNVILELGFFLGKLGRSKVVVLYRESDRFEMPSDFAGVLYIPYDARGSWKFEITQELKSAGFDVDSNKII